MLLLCSCKVPQNHCLQYISQLYFKQKRMVKCSMHGSVNKQPVLVKPGSVVANNTNSEHKGTCMKDHSETAAYKGRKDAASPPVLVGQLRFTKQPQPKLGKFCHRIIYQVLSYVLCSTPSTVVVSNSMPFMQRY